jgi:hypothetical protein
MSEPLHSAPTPASTRPASAPSEQHIAAWLDLMTACEEMLLAGLRREVGPKGDVMAAYRHWYAEQMEDHARMLEHMCREFNRRLP